MNILFSINHPAHVHFFRNSIKILKKENYNIWVTARDKELTVPLLKHYDIDYILLSKQKRSFINSIKEYFSHQYYLFKILKDKKINLVLSIGGVFSSLSAWALGIPSIEFSDTEHAWFQHFLTYPFLTILYTPSCYLSYMGKKQIRYQGYHELAYLHPKYYKSDDLIIRKMGINRDEKFVLLRFVSWQASHDLGQGGLSLKTKRKLIRELSTSARVFISSEEKLDDEFQPYAINIKPWEIHDVIANATLLITEGATMASEGAILGTPTIYINSLKLGYIEEQRCKYKLVYSFRNDDHVSSKAHELINNNAAKKEWLKKKENLIRETTDITGLILSSIKKVSS